MTRTCVSSTKAVVRHWWSTAVRVPHIACCQQGAFCVPSAVELYTTAPISCLWPRSRFAHLSKSNSQLQRCGKPWIVHGRALDTRWSIADMLHEPCRSPCAGIDQQRSLICVLQDDCIVCADLHIVLPLVRLNMAEDSRLLHMISCQLSGAGPSQYYQVKALSGP